MALETPFLQPVAGSNSDGVLVLSLSSPSSRLSRRRPAQLPGSPAAPKLLSLLSGTLSGFARFFSHLLRPPPPEAPQRRRDFSLLLPALPGAGLSREHEERPGRLSLLLRAALALPGRPPGGRLPRQEDASAGQSWPMPVSTVVSTTSHLRPPPASSTRSSSLLHAGPAGAPARRGRGGGGGADRKVETELSTFKETAARLTPPPPRRPLKLLFPGHFLPGPQTLRAWEVGEEMT
uniref:Regulator of G-protein signaling 20-like n=1 Tax=Camelus bactrianus TaxID=9837 RepID=A0A9W3FM44_CAMBA|nr:regulator of G-protein signaling 20-like [Camelus bactrianus]